MSSVKTATKSDGDFAAHMDLRTLIEAEKIRRDGKRHKAALRHHKKMLSEHEKQGQAIAAVKGPRVSEGPKSAKRDDHDGDEGGY